MVALVGVDGEERVVGRDAVPGQPVEEGGEGVVVRLERRDVAGLAGTVRRSTRVRVVRIGDVGVGDRDAALLHGGHVGERHRGGHPVEAGEARIAVGIGDRLAGEVGQRAAGADQRRHPFVPKRPLNPSYPPGSLGNRSGRPPLSAEQSDEAWAQCTAIPT